VIAPRHLLVAALGLTVLVAACTSSGSSSLPSMSAEPSTSAEPSASAGASASDAGGSTGSTGCPTSQPAPLPAGETRTVTIETDKGTFAIKVDGALSPIAAGNFVALAECGFYDGVVFHRLVPGFVIQGGDPTGTGTGGPGYTIKDEPVTATYGRGTVAMARTSEPDSVGSQFFVVLDDAAREALASYNTYQIIGSVESGMEVVDTIAAMPNSGSDTGNMALDPVAMTKVTVGTP
jgi:cyclophilin family peptidyl-prolyl cis-trans isomerase